MLRYHGLTYCAGTNILVLLEREYVRLHVYDALTLTYLSSILVPDTTDEHINSIHLRCSPDGSLIYVAYGDAHPEDYFVIAAYKVSTGKCIVREDGRWGGV